RPAASPGAATFWTPWPAWPWAELYGCFQLLLHEVQHPTPGVVASLAMLNESAVEKGVRRTGVDLHLVRDAGSSQLVVKPVKFLLGREVGTGYQQKQRRFHLRHVLANAAGNTEEPDR